MLKKGYKPTEKQKAAGAANLKAYTDKHGHLAPLKHGAKSQTIKSRFKDGRTAEGKWLKAVIQAVVDDLGGPKAINAGQQLILSNLRSKLIVLSCIGAYIDKLDNLMAPDEDLIPIMKKRFLTYSNSVTRDIDQLYRFCEPGKNRRIATIEEIVNGHNTE